MATRRDFLRLSAAAVCVASTTKLFGAASHPPFGVQLYTVRDQAEHDLPGVLAAIHDIGYREVETYWNVYNRPASELRRMINDHGLAVPSGHFDYDGLAGKLDYAHDLGLQWVVCPMLPKGMWNSLDGFKRAADQFNLWGDEIRKRGMRFAFHNHNYEFRRFDSTTGFDTLLRQTDPKLVWLEMDCYWITQAGRDPLQMMKEHASRIKLLHLKDRQSGFQPSQELNASAEHFAEIGNGTLDWHDILPEAERIGVEHWFVEQDNSSRPPLESLRISFNNLQRLVSSPDGKHVG